MKKTISIIPFLLMLFVLQAQEQLIPLQNNENTNKNRKAGVLTLPFFDNFSQTGIYPSPDLWADKNAFVNNSYPVEPVNYGVATLDALDSTGNIYAYGSTGTFIADKLTSLPVKLDSLEENGTMRPYLLSDSVYFSFYYQPQGLGSIPARDDSLVLQFKTYQNGVPVWKNVWAAPGDTLEIFYGENGTYFKQVILPVDSIYFIPDFQFRFMNYASLSSIPSWQSNTDQWNIDQVYLNKGRNVHDIYYPCVDFVNNPPNILHPYTSLPLRHFDPAYAEDSYNLFIGNTDSLTHAVNYQNEFTFEILEDNFTYSGESAPFQYNEVFATVPLGYGNLNTALTGYVDSAAATFSETLTCDELGINKSRTHYLIFHNYFAYDDGTPEAGYGVTGANPQFAFQFITKEVDTLRGMKIYFNKTLSNANNQYFTIGVWNDAQNKPGLLLYESEIFTMEDTVPAGYQNFIFDDGGFEMGVGTYYIGIRQSSNKIINIGFDRNNDNHSFLFWNADGSWLPSSMEGSVMMRPLFGHLTTDGIRDHVSTKQQPFSLYPNPYNGGTLTFIFPEKYSGENINGQLNVYNTTGEKLYSGKYFNNNRMRFPFLQPGLYIIELLRSNGDIFRTKLIVK